MGGRWTVRYQTVQSQLLQVLFSLFCFQCVMRIGSDHPVFSVRGSDKQHVALHIQTIIVKTCVPSSVISWKRQCLCPFSLQTETNVAVAAGMCCTSGSCYRNSHYTIKCRCICSRCRSCNCCGGDSDGKLMDLIVAGIAGDSDPDKAWFAQLFGLYEAQGTSQSFPWRTTFVFSILNFDFKEVHHFYSYCAPLVRLWHFVKPHLSPIFMSSCLWCGCSRVAGNLMNGMIKKKAKTPTTPSSEIWEEFRDRAASSSSGCSSSGNSSESGKLVKADTCVIMWTGSKRLSPAQLRRMIICVKWRCPDLSELENPRSFVARSNHDSANDPSDDRGISLDFTERQCSAVFVNRCLWLHNTRGCVSSNFWSGSGTMQLRFVPVLSCLTSCSSLSSQNNLETFYATADDFNLLTTNDNTMWTQRRWNENLMLRNESLMKQFEATARSMGWSTQLMNLLGSFTSCTHWISWK